MAWPTPQEYNEAIQSPRICFSDPELRLGTPALNSLGLPRPISGAFASVYRVDCQQRSWAVRCFLREYADQQQRYSAISRHLRTAGLPCMVGFQFLEKGILVKGRWYPILKMEWVEGESLSEYLHRNRNDRPALSALSLRWLGLIRSLRKHEIAHGDLQHGNILVSDGDLKLIDYDAMFVPALMSLESHEVGHRNYQHPNRTSRDFGPDLDNFSAWVIATSISAQASAPELWGQLNAGDECLLFRREDFEKPEGSKALRALAATEHPGIVRIAAELRRIFKLPNARIPNVGDWVLESSTSVIPARPSMKVSIVPGRPGWLNDHVDGRANHGSSRPPSEQSSPAGEMEARRWGWPVGCPKCKSAMEKFDSRQYRCKWCGSIRMIQTGF
ncbi:MAG: hypothetical protein BGO49_17285 [Planctomycetales bacterium 71-10]|nr:MAG: hypothetical protein BGO49_17285 [Planctomycetales bacterium 71-10]